MTTAGLVLFPVLAQIRAGEFRVRDIWAYLLFAAGLFAIGASYTFLEDANRRTLSGAGLLAMVIGLLAGELGSGPARRY